MEDEPLFNAGRGSVLDENGHVSCDASIMRGNDAACGSVCGLKTSRHPIRAANFLLHEDGPIMLISPAADDYSAIKGIEIVNEKWLKTKLRTGKS
jgi:L-asparaginase / beta-aspartyl-peptidase